jgi:hypothetical protein
VFLLMMATSHSGGDGRYCIGKSRYGFTPHVVLYPAMAHSGKGREDLHRMLFAS